MKVHLLEKILAMSVFVKAVAYKKGSLLLVSTSVSVGVYEVFKKLTAHIDFNTLVMPLVVIVACVSVYFLFFIIDLVMGLVASKHENLENTDWIESSKLYSSLGKLGGVLLIDVILLTILMFLTMLDFETTTTVFLLITISINVLAMMWELHSIGENVKRRTGSKPSLFHFLDRVTTILEKKIINRISKTIDPKGDDYPEGEG